MHPFTLSRPTESDEAIRQHRDASAATAFLAGGTTLLDLMRLDVMQPDHVIDLHSLGLTAIAERPDGGLRIGALVRNSDLAWHPTVRERYPVLAEAVLSGASPQVRNMATTGGNLLQRTRCPYFRDNTSPCNKRAPGSGCAALEGYHRSHAILGTSEQCIATHPSDLCVALAALDAVVELRGDAGERTLPLRDFHLAPGDTPERENILQKGELIAAVLLPPPLARARSWYVKTRERDAFAFALAAAAVVLQIDRETIGEARVALGGIATKPWRSPEAENVLRGAAATPATFRAAAEAALQRAQPRRDNAFKVPLAKLVLVRALTLVAVSQPQVRRV